MLKKILLSAVGIVFFSIAAQAMGSDQDGVHGVKAVTKKIILNHSDDINTGQNFTFTQYKEQERKTVSRWAKKEEPIKEIEKQWAVTEISSYYTLPIPHSTYNNLNIDFSKEDDIYKVNVFYSLALADQAKRGQKLLSMSLKEL